MFEAAGAMSGILDFFHTLSHDVLFNSSTNAAASLWRIRLSSRRLFDASVRMTYSRYKFFEPNSSSECYL